MTQPVVLLSVPGLRRCDLSSMPNLRALLSAGEIATLVPGTPAVTCTVQANMTTGRMPREHGVVANGFFWRDRGEVEMWTSPNECIQQPQIWDFLRQHDSQLTSAVWFPLHSKHCGADYVCTPAPIHNPDGSESLWCYTRPTELYGQLRDSLGHFPLQHFWGPAANIRSTAWIIDSLLHAVGKWAPHLVYAYLPHLDYAAQMMGPDSPAAFAALAALDQQLARLIEGLPRCYAATPPLWIVTSEYAIAPVTRVGYPNRVLREMGLLDLGASADEELLCPATSRAWALCDHQIAHVYVRDPADVGSVVDRFRRETSVGEVLVADDLVAYGLDHDRSGEVVLLAKSDAWFAYYWWLDDQRAPGFARTVDIHRKPGYDPVELFLDSAKRRIPLDASLVRGSHGAPAPANFQQAIVGSSRLDVLGGPLIADCDLAEVVLRQFGTSLPSDPS